MLQRRTAIAKSIASHMHTLSLSKTQLPNVFEPFFCYGQTAVEIQTDKAMAIFTQAFTRSAKRRNITPANYAKHSRRKPLTSLLFFYTCSN